MYRYTELHFRQRNRFFSSTNLHTRRGAHASKDKMGNSPREPNGSYLDVMLRTVMSVSTYQTPTQCALNNFTVAINDTPHDT
jgi:hypothetical protein